MATTAPEISIIVPVYNGDPYFQACLDSIVNQTFTDWELLLIDDGSTDGSGLLCDKYAGSDNRIRVFHQKNQGQSVARNHGLEHVCGKYITMIDADDLLLSDNYLQLLHETSEKHNAQISCCDLFAFIDDNRPQTPAATSITAEIIDGKTICSLQHTPAYYGFGTPVAKLYQRALFQELRYPEGRIAEDNAIAHRLFFPCDTVAVLHFPMYGYRRWHGSTLRRIPAQRILEDTILAFQDRIDYFHSLGYENLADLSEQEMLRVLNILKSAH